MVFDSLPVLTATGTTARPQQNGAAVTLLAGTTTVTDPDSGGRIKGASVALTNGKAGDVLEIGGTPFGSGSTTYTDASSSDATKPTFTVSYSNYTLTITSPVGADGVTDTDADYAHLLSEVQYQDGSSDDTARAFVLQVNDGAYGLPSGTNNVQTTVKIESPPTVTSTQVSVVEGATATGAAGAALTGDVNSGTGNSSGLTVTAVTYGGQSSAAGTAVQGAYGTLTIDTDGSYTYVANRTAAIDAATQGAKPVESGFTYTVSDGTLGTAESFTATIDRPPTVGGTATAASYTEGASGTAVDPGITVSDPDGNPITGATVAIGNGTYFAGDTLGVAVSGNVTVASDTGGVLTLTGSASAASYQTILQSVTYRSTSGNPDDYGTDKSRSIAFQVQDADASSAGKSDTVAVTAVNDPPALSGTDTKTFVQGTAGMTGTAVAVDDQIAATDPDNTTLAGATVRISGGNFTGDGDELRINGNLTGSISNGTDRTITYAYNSSNEALTLSGNDTLADYRNALRLVTFDSTSLNPTNYGASTSRTVSFVANDGSSSNNFSNTLNAAVDVTATDQPPTVTASGSTVTFQTTGASSAPVTVDGGVTVTDPDDQNLASATVKVTNYKAGDVLGFISNPATTGTITGSYDSAGTLTLAPSTGTTATVAQFQAALDAVTFDNTSANLDTTTRTITFAANDGSASVTAASTDMVAVQAAPVITGEGYTSGSGTDIDVGKVVTFAVTLSQDVTVTVGGNGAPYLTLNTGQAEVATYTGESGGVLGFSYTVQPGDDVADLKATAITVPAGTTIRDANGRDADLSGYKAIDTGVIVDTTPPTIAAYGAPNPTGQDLKSGTVTFSFTTSEAVTATGSTLALNNGGTATYTSGSGTAASPLLYTYTIPTAGHAQDTADLQATTLNGALTDGAGNALADNSFAAIDSRDQIDTTPPTIAAYGAPNPTGQDLKSGTVTFSFTTSEAVTATGSTLALNNGGTATYTSGSGTAASPLLYTYTIPTAGHAQDTVDLQATTLNGALTDGAGNALADNSFAAIDSRDQVDTTPPTIAAYGAPNPTGQDLKSGTVTFTFTTSEAVTATGSTLALNNGGTATYTSGSGTAASPLLYTYTIPTAGHAQDTADLQATTLNGALTDGAGNALADNSFAAIDSRDQIDTTPPTIAAYGAPNPTGQDLKSGTVTFSFTTSEAVTATGSTLALNNGGTATYTSGSGTAASPLLYTYTIPTAGHAQDTVDLQATTLNGALTDGAGNALADNSFAAIDSRDQVDTVAPTIASESATPTGQDLNAGKVVTFTIGASEAVNTATSALTLSDGGTATYASGSGTSTLVYSYTVAAGDANTGDLRATALTGSVTDNAGNALADNSFAAIDSRDQVDTTPPTIAAYGAPNPTGQDLKSGTVTFSFTTSEAVTATGSSLALNNGGTASYTSGSGTAASPLLYTYTIPTTGHAQDTVDLQATTLDGTFTDGAGNALDDNSFTAIDSRDQVDTTPPTLGTATSASPSGTDIGAGKTVTFTIATSEPVTVTEGGAAPTLQLDNNEVATYAGQTGTPVGSLTFSYTVKAGDDVADLQATAFDALQANTTIRDGAGNDADLSGYEAIDTGVKVDTVAPTLGAESSASAGGNDIGAGKVVTFTVATSEPVTVTNGGNGLPTLKLNDGQVATYAGQTGAPVASLVFSYEVQPGDTIADLMATAFNALPSGTTIQDGAGNDADLGGFKAIDTGTMVDTTAPAVSSPSLTVAENSAATPIGIAAPTDAGTPSPAIMAGALPTDGTVTLADGTPVATGQALTAGQLTGLLFTPTAGAYSRSSAFTYSATDGAGNASTGTATLAVGGPGNPAIAGTVAGQTTAREAPVRPFAGAALSDPNGGATDTLAIALSGGGGTLMDGPGRSGLTRTGADSYSLAAGTPDAVTAELEALVFTPTAGRVSRPNTTTFTLIDASSAGTGTSDASTTVTDMASPLDTVSLDPDPAFQRHGTFLLTGTASSSAGVESVEISAAVDGVATDLGPATLKSDGIFTFTDPVGAHVQSAITATVTDDLGGTASYGLPLSLQAGLQGAYVAREDRYTPDGSAVTTSTSFRRDGSSTVGIDAQGQTVTSQPFQVFENHGLADTSFVFDRGFGIDVISGFKVGGAHHDVIDLPASDFTGIADVLRHTGDIQGSAWITDPKTGDAIRFAGVTTAELTAHPKDFIFGA